MICQKVKNVIAAMSVIFLAAASPALGADDTNVVMTTYEARANSPLFVVGLEKGDPHQVGRIAYGWQGHPCPASASCLHLERLPRGSVKGRLKELDDPRPLFISHIARLRGSSDGPSQAPCVLVYSAYRSQECGKPQALTLRDGIGATDGWTALERDLRGALAAEIKSRRATHLVIMSMGWKELQPSSLAHFANWADGLDRELGRGQAAYRPVYVGITWPALWGDSQQAAWLKNVSLTNKLNDADEAGLTWASILVNRVAGSLKKENPDLKTVLIGHSFGARMLSQASYSWPTLSEHCDLAAQPDLLIGLQGAFSAARFIRGKGSEGSPYQAFADCGPKAAFTNSRNDDAMDAALLQSFARAKYMGHPASTKLLKRNSAQFEQVQPGAAGAIPSPPPGRKILLIQADDLIDSHTDVFNCKVIKLMADLIQAYAPGQATLAANVR